MHKYRVVERLSNESRVVLKCRSGRYHFARALGVLPPENGLLQGDKPHLGFGVLTCSESSSMFRVIFESINHTDAESSMPMGLSAVPPSASASAPARA